MSDQKALSDIYNLTGSREFSDFPEKLRNLSEATMKYNFHVVYVPGKINLITIRINNLNCVASRVLVPVMNPPP